ncbi:MAG: hypothetical protein RBS39_00755 [Phycisphaerales bacterium]|jgi:hypothetical protein|nr:hypothetical protein [Phycisphaerales bacterium]
MARRKHNRSRVMALLALVLLCASIGVVATGVGERTPAVQKLAAGVAAQGVVPRTVRAFRESPLAVGLAAGSLVVLGLAGVSRVGRGGR